MSRHDAMSSREIIKRMGGLEVFMGADRPKTRAPRHASFDEVCRIEPSLRALFREIPGIMARGCDPWMQWAGIKRRFCRVVGWDGNNPELANDYELVYRVMLEEAERCWPK